MRANSRAANCSGLPSPARWCIGRDLLLADEPTGKSRPAHRGANAGAVARAGQSQCRRRHSDHSFAHGGRNGRSHPGARCGGLRTLEHGRERPRAIPAALSPFGGCCCWRNCANQPARLLVTRARASRWEWRWAPRCTWSTMPRSMNLAWRRNGWWAKPTSWCGVRAKDSPRELFARLARTIRRSAWRVRCSNSRCALPGRRDTLKVLGVDPFRAAALQPALIGDIGDGAVRAVRTGRHLSEQQRRAGAHAAARRIAAGHRRQFAPRRCTCSAFFGQGTYSQALGFMDIASAQWTFNAVGRFNRIDLRLSARHRRRVICAAARKHAARRCSRHCAAGRARPRGDRDARVSRQSQHAGAGRVVDRRVSGVLDAITLGAAQTPIASAAACAGRDARPVAAARCIGEGAALGLAGSLLGVILGALFAAAILRFSPAISATANCARRAPRCTRPARHAGISSDGDRGGEPSAPGCRRAPPHAKRRPAL